MQDLWLKVEPDPEGTGCRVTLEDASGAPLVAAAVPASLSCDPEALRAVGELAERDPLPGVVERLGATLGDHLLPPAVREALSRRLALDPQEPARLRLALREPRWQPLPWEYATASLTGEASREPLALQAELHLARAGGAAAGGALPAPEPLRVLVAWSDPASPAYPNLPHQRAEVRAVLAALEAPGRRILVDEHPYATPPGLQRALAELRPHVLHFVGHGDERPSGGVLLLHGGSSGQETALYGDELARWLRPLLGSPDGLRVAVLSACRSAAAGCGVAESLAAAGVPAVVAMQLPLRDAAAGAFAGAFYEALARAQPVEEAVRRGRLALREHGADWGAPVHLPYLRSPYFVGRESLLGALHRLLRDEEYPVALVGMGGLGKSQLAVEYGHRHRAEYPGGLFWVNARDPLRLQEDLAALGRFFDVPEQLPVRERALRVRDALQQVPQPALLIADNLTEATDTSLLPSVGACRVLATTRHGGLVEGRFRTVRLPLLDETASLALLQTHRRAATAEELSAAREIAAILGHLPLALAVVARHVRRLDLSFVEYHERLAGSGRVETLDRASRSFVTATGHPSTIYDALDLSHQTLDVQSARLLALAACFAGRGIPEDLLDAVAGLPRDDFEEALADLEERWLVNREAAGAVSVHALVRTYALGRMEDAARAEVVCHAAAVQTERLKRANDTMEWHVTAAELPHARAVEVLCRTYELPAALYPLLRELGGHRFAHWDLDLAHAYFQDALRCVDRLHGRRHRDAAYLLVRTAEVEHFRRCHPAALKAAREAVALAEMVLPSDDPALADFYNTLGFVLKMQGRFQEAEPHYQRALRLCEERCPPGSELETTCLNNLGALLEAQGDFGGALRHYTRALELDTARCGPQHQLTAIRLNNIGRVLSEMGAWTEAEARHRTALAIHEATFGPRHLHVAMTHYYLMNVLRQQGRRDAAIAHAEAALPILRQNYGEEHERYREVEATLCSLRHQG
jgi:tetratricopeptide (TPR) repeat protein